MKLLICGDFTTCNRGRMSVEVGNAFSYSVQAIIKKHDATIVNLEAPVVRGQADGIKKHGPLLRTENQTLTFLNNNGVGYVTLANNHFYDYGDNGVIETMDALSQHNMKAVGGGKNEMEKTKPLLLNNGTGYTVCILNYCESEFSVDHEMGSNKLNPIQAYYDIKKAKDKDYFVIVIVHGGHEGYQLPSPRMKQLYRFFIDCGANVVINHHQHCYSGYECYHDGMIFYGLGNFFFDKISKSIGKEWFEGYMVGLYIEDGCLNGYQLFPYNQCKDDRVETRLMEGLDKDTFFNKIEELNKVIADDILLEEHFKAFADSQEKNYLLRFSPYTIGKLAGACRRGLLPMFVGKKKKIRILNAISCEAHRDACIYLLRK